MVCVSRTCVDFLTADVGENPFGIARVLRDEPVHLGDRGCDALRVRVVESKAHSKDIASNEALVGVGQQSFRVCMPATVEKEGRNRLDRFAVEFRLFGVWSFGHVDHANDDRCHSGPFVSPPCIEDRPTVYTDPTETRRACVSLADGVRCN